VSTAQPQTQAHSGVSIEREAALAGSKAQLGIELFEEGNYQKASDLLSEALEQHETAELWNDWAAAEAACGRTEKAADGFRRALALEADNSQALANLGVLLLCAGREQEAIPFLMQAAIRVDLIQRSTVERLLASCSHKVIADSLSHQQGVLEIAVESPTISSGQPAPAPAAPEPVAQGLAVAVPPAWVRQQRLFSLDKYVVDRGPRSLTLESSSVCNLRCVMCPQARGLVHRPKHFETRLLDKLLRHLADVEDVQLHGIGEPLLSPAFWRFLETPGFPEGAHISVNTNLTVLTDDQIGTILGSCLSMIQVSLDAATPETYAKIRGYDFGKVIHNIKRLISRRHAEGREKPAIFLNMTMMRENIEELEAFVELGHSLGVQGIVVWHMNAGEDYQITTKGGWTFDYKGQMLRNYPRLSNEKLRAAIALAERLGIRLRMDTNKDVFLEEGL